MTFHVEHIIAPQHLNGVVDAIDDPDLLALACDRCNAYKGTNLTSVDPDTRTVVRLYDPRKDVWSDHFVLRSSEIAGLTPSGRATVRLLQMNAPQRVELREEWIQNSGDYS